MLTLYTTALSANGRKPLAVARHLGLEVDVREVNVYRGDGATSRYRAVNPFGKIPTLVDGELVLWESNAIARYLDEAYGDGALSGRGPVERATIGRWLFWEAAHWQPAMGRILAPIVGHRVRPDAIPPPSAAPDWRDPALAPLLTFLEGQLAEERWLALDRLTLADLVVAAMMTYAAIASFPAAAYPAVRRWYAEVAALDAWRRSAHPLWERY
ncbi:MAG: glutathione S-transferase family protein [Nannocystaceae bacterium]